MIWWCVVYFDICTFIFICSNGWCRYKKNSICRYAWIWNLVQLRLSCPSLQLQFLFSCLLFPVPFLLLLGLLQTILEEDVEDPVYQVNASAHACAHYWKSLYQCKPCLYLFVYNAYSFLLLSYCLLFRFDF